MLTQLRRATGFTIVAILTIFLVGCGSADPADDTGVENTTSTEDTEDTEDTQSRPTAEPRATSDSRGEAVPATSSLTGDPADDSWLPVTARDDLSGATPYAVSEMALIDDSTIAIRFMAIGEGCSGAYVDTQEDRGSVTVTLMVGLPPEAAFTTCINEPVKKELRVTLDAEVGRRTVIATEAEAGTIGRSVPVGMSVDDYLGLTVAEAEAVAEPLRRIVRVLWIDGEGLVGTDDFIPDRLNLKVQDGIVIGVKTDGGESAGDTDGI